MGETHKRNMVRSRSLLLLLAALASTVVAATASADWKRGLDAIVTKLQTNDDASALVQEVDTIVSENRDPLGVAEPAAAVEAAVASATAASTAAAVKDEVTIML